MKNDAKQPDLSHLDASGSARMVDVSAKPATQRVAVASALVELGPEVYDVVLGGGLSKGDVLAAARIAGIQAAKRTGDLIPLCHGLAPEFVEIRFDPHPPHALRIEAEVRIVARTGVEMEALVAASIAALTIYDMCKSLSKAISIGPVRLDRKSGGKSGDYHAHRP